MGCNTTTTCSGGTKYAREDTIRQGRDSCTCSSDTSCGGSCWSSAGRDAGPRDGERINTRDRDMQDQNSRGEGCSGCSSGCTGGCGGGCSYCTTSCGNGSSSRRGGGGGGSYSCSGCDSQCARYCAGCGGSCQDGCQGTCQDQCASECTGEAREIPKIKKIMDAENIKELFDFILYEAEERRGYKEEIDDYSLAMLCYIANYGKEGLTKAHFNELIKKRNEKILSSEPFIRQIESGSSVPTDQITTLLTVTGDTDKKLDLLFDILFIDKTYFTSIAYNSITTTNNNSSTNNSYIKKYKGKKAIIDFYKDFSSIDVYGLLMTTYIANYGQSGFEKIFYQTLTKERNSIFKTEIESNLMISTEDIEKILKIKSNDTEEIKNNKKNLVTDILYTTFYKDTENLYNDNEKVKYTKDIINQVLTGTYAKKVPNEIINIEEGLFEKPASTTTSTPTATIYDPAIDLKNLNDNTLKIIAVLFNKGERLAFNETGELIKCITIKDNESKKLYPQKEDNFITDLLQKREEAYNNLEKNKDNLPQTIDFSEFLNNSEFLSLLNFEFSDRTIDNFPYSSEINAKLMKKSNPRLYELLYSNNKKMSSGKQQLLLTDALLFGSENIITRTNYENITKSTSYSQKNTLQPFYQYSNDSQYNKKYDSFAGLMCAYIAIHGQGGLNDNIFKIYSELRDNENILSLYSDEENYSKVINNNTLETSKIIEILTQLNDTDEKIITSKNAFCTDHLYTCLFANTSTCLSSFSNQPQIFFTQDNYNKIMKGEYTKNITDKIGKIIEFGNRTISSTVITNKKPIPLEHKKLINSIKNYSKEEIDEIISLLQYQIPRIFENTFTNILGQEIEKIETKDNKILELTNISSGTLVKDENGNYNPAYLDGITEKEYKYFGHKASALEWLELAKALYKEIIPVYDGKPDY